MTVIPQSQRLIQIDSTYFASSTCDPVSSEHSTTFSQQFFHRCQQPIEPIYLGEYFSSPSNNNKLRKLFFVECLLGFNELINKINLMQGVSENELIEKDQYQDIQIDSNNCCTPSFRSSKSSHSIEHTRNSQKSLKNGKEKGIKLTHKTKSSSTLTLPLKLASKISEPIKLNQKMSKKNEDSHISCNALSNLQRCISYKNQKIREHMQEENEPSILCLLTPAKDAREEELYSTRKNTARTLNSSYDLPLIERTPRNTPSNASIEPAIFKQFRQERSLIRSQHVLLINPKHKQPRKTLEKVFEETQGKRIVTLESQFSNDDECSNEYSIAEAYEFPLQS